MSVPRKCHPHYCPFNSPACPESCKCECKRVKPHHISVTTQEATNVSARQGERTTQTRSYSTRERVFGVPYDPRKDIKMSSTQDAIIQSYHNLEEYAIQRCCQETCKCSLGEDCNCRKR
ncbi:hypothetical protein JTE90_028496 [Oedothorax gibbosus]|uniref:Metallothionein n=1 Tax=Oedothorax gibbosus TaxID=931172 RepID=A0AAV6VWY3_9ARAC|nr:hypothetical protein JTE90_028496 [Oedothorax gibbosus]